MQSELDKRQQAQLRHGMKQCNYSEQYHCEFLYVILSLKQSRSVGRRYLQRDHLVPFLCVFAVGKAIRFDYSEARFDFILLSLLHADSGTCLYRSYKYYLE